MEIIRMKTKNILPTMQSSILDSLLKLLEDIGVTEEDELKYVQEADLTGILKPIQARKLIDAWKQLDINDNSGPSANNEGSLSSSAAASNDTSVGPAASNATSAILPSTTMKTDWAEAYIILWEKMSGELLKALKEDKLPTPKCRRELVNIISLDIHKVCAKPGKKNLSIIAKKAIQQYPSLSDVWCDEMVAGGYESLTRSFMVKFENLNRRDVFSAAKRSLKKSDGDADSVAKARSLSQYGCINWQPNLLPVGESTDSQVEKKKEMTGISLMMKPGQKLSEDSLALIEATYYTQRTEINHMPNMCSLLSSWPLLFTENGFLYHFKLLTGVAIDTGIINCNKVQRIINFFKSNPKNNIQEIFSEFPSEGSDLKLVISLLLEHFNEKLEAVFISVDSSVTSRDIEGIVRLPNTPCLISCGDDMSFMVAVDKKVINEEVTSFELGFCMMFAAYYILNIEYAEMACATLEFIQRCFLKINPEKGSKASTNKKKRTSLNPKVLSLLNKLMDFEWC